MEMRSSLMNVGKGFCMGAADVVPGVSGGTMAVILGIYQRLINAIRAVDVEFVGHLLCRRLREAASHVDLWFLLPLAFGIGAGLLFFTRVVPLPELIRSHPVPVYSLFFGLIAASIVVLIRSLGGFRPRDVATLALGCALGFGVVNLVPAATPDASWFIFLSGALAICAMILPGISGSFILLILQKYAYVFGAIGRFDLSVLLPFGLGAATGLILFSRFIAWLLRHYHRPTITVIIGLLLGSLWMVWPFQHRLEVVVADKPRIIRSTPYFPDLSQIDVLIAAGYALTGLVFVFALQLIADSRGVSGPD